MDPASNDHSGNTQQDKCEEKSTDRSNIMMPKQPQADHQREDEPFPTRRQKNPPSGHSYRPIFCNDAFLCFTVASGFNSPHRLLDLGRETLATLGIYGQGIPNNSARCPQP
jgi:hypothetical protein